MIYTKESLLQILEQYDESDILVGALWSKIDVEYQIAEIQSELEYEGITQEQIDSFNPAVFWDSYYPIMDNQYENNVSFENDELYIAVLRNLRGED